VGGDAITNRRANEGSRENRELEALLAKARESVLNHEFALAKRYADDALVFDPGNIRAREIKQEAEAGERKAFGEIDIK
jgi:hypothetical protein